MTAWMSLKFGQISLLVSMATDRVMMENGVATFSQLFFIQSFSYLQVMMTCMRARRSSKFSQIRLLTAELAALERQVSVYRTISPLVVGMTSVHSPLQFFIWPHLCTSICWGHNVS